MTQKQIERIVGEWKKRLGLTGWDLRVNFEDPCSDDAHATMSRSNVYERAELHLDPEWAKWDQKFTNLIVVHELMHLLARDLEESLKLSEPSPGVNRTQDRAIEQMVDRLAYRFVDLAGLV